MKKIQKLKVFKPFLRFATIAAVVYIKISFSNLNEGP